MVVIPACQGGACHAEESVERLCTKTAPADEYPTTVAPAQAGAHNPSPPWIPDYSGMTGLLSC